MIAIMLFGDIMSSFVGFRLITDSSDGNSRWWLFLKHSPKLSLHFNSVFVLPVAFRMIFFLQRLVWLPSFGSMGFIRKEKQVFEFSAAKTCTVGTIGLPKMK